MSNSNAGELVEDKSGCILFEAALYLAISAKKHKCIKHIFYSAKMILKNHLYKSIIGLHGPEAIVVCDSG